MRQALIDGDILCYEIGYAAETGWQDKTSTPSWDYTEELLTSRILQIQIGAEAQDCAPIIFVSGQNNFRHNLAKRRPYKGNRDDLKKPWHYNNIKQYLLGAFNAELVEGMEADDAMAIEQCAREDTIICSRDKDLRMVPGLFYSWELGKQPSYGPVLHSDPGILYMDRGSVKGYGKMFFYAQCLIGDPVDNIPGIPGCGAVKAFNLLKNVKDAKTACRIVLREYKRVFKNDGLAEMQEQAQLLWIVRELDENNNPVMWKMEE